MATAAGQAATIGDNNPPLITLDQLKRDFAHVETAIVDLEQRIAGAPPVLEDEEDHAIIIKLVPEIAKFSKRCDTLRDEQGRPHLEAKRVIDGFFKALQARLDAHKATLEKRGTTYLNKKAAAERARREAEEAAARAAAAEQERKAAEAVAAGKIEDASLAQARAEDLKARAEHEAEAAGAKAADLARSKTESGTGTLREEWTFEIENIDQIDMNALRPFLTVAAIEQALRAYVKAGRRELKGVRIFVKSTAKYYGG